MSDTFFSGREPVILNGQRLYVVVKTNSKPRWIPTWLWRWMVRKVVNSQTVTTETHYTRPQL